MQKTTSDILKVRSSISDLHERMMSAATWIDSKRSALSSVSAEAIRLQRAVQTMNQTQDMSVDDCHKRREAINDTRDKLQALNAEILAVDESAAATFAKVKQMRAEISDVELHLSSSASRTSSDDTELRASLVQALQERLAGVYPS